MADTALSQLNHGHEQLGDMRPMLSDMRGSGSMGHSASVVAEHHDEPTATIAVAFRNEPAHCADMAADL